MTKDDFYSSISSDMKLTKGFFLRIYGYELSHPGFAEIALDKLEKLGCIKARNYYTGIVGGYEQEHDKVMNNVAAWYRKQDFHSKKGGSSDWRLANTHQNSSSAKQNASLLKRLEKLKECL